MTEFADGNMSDTATPSKMSEEKAVNNKDEKAGEVENRQEADNQDSTGASHRAIPVDVEPFCGENRYERLPSNGSDKSCLEGIDVVFSETSRDASGELWSVDRIGDAIRMKKRDSQKIDKEEKVDEKVIPVFDSEERNIVIPEACAPSEHAEIITKTKEFSEQDDTKRLDVILYETGEITQVRDLLVRHRTSDTTENDLNKKSDYEQMEEAKIEDEKFPFLERETHSTAIQDARAQSEPTDKKMQNREEQKEDEMEINVPKTDQHGNVEELVDLSAKDLLCFTWQIAEGMVSAKIKTTLGQWKYMTC